MIQRFLCLAVMLTSLVGCSESVPTMADAEGKRYYEPEHLVMIIPELQQQPAEMPGAIFEQIAEVRDDLASLSPEERQAQEQLDGLATEISKMSPENTKGIQEKLQAMLDIAKENAEM